MAFLLKLVETLESWLTELERRTNPKLKHPDRRAQLPSEGRLLLYAVLFVFAPPLPIVGIVLLGTDVLVSSGLGEPLLYSIVGIIHGIAGLTMTLPRYEDLGLPSPYKHHPWIPLALYGILSLAFVSMALWHAVTVRFWAIIGFDIGWLVVFSALAIGKLVLDQQRATDAPNAAPTGESHG